MYYNYSNFMAALQIGLKRELKQSFYNVMQIKNWL